MTHMHSKTLSNALVIAVTFIASGVAVADSGSGFNVLFVAVDDMRAELGCYGSEAVRSPNLDKLAQRSVRFNRAYCQQALCNPSRASLMTGLRVDTLGIFGLTTHFRDIRPEIVTLPQLFKQNDYTSVGIGKIFHNWRQDRWKGDEASWSIPAVLHYGNHNRDFPQTAAEVPPNELTTPRVEKRAVPDDAYWDGRIADEAISALRELRDAPFFLGVGFWKPHLPFNAPARYWNLYDPGDLRPPRPAGPPRGVPKIALHNGSELLRDFPDGLTAEQTMTLRHGYYAAISYVDAQIGRVLDELDRLGLRESTIVVFWSDHGFHLGEHDLWCKTSNFELDARVPLLISVPGMQAAGKSTDALVELTDLYPTLADICELTPGHRLEGVSLRPVLQDAKSQVRPFALTQAARPPYVKKGDQPEAMGYSVRTSGHRYTQWVKWDTQEVIAEELYDHGVDPLETANLIETAAGREVADRLARYVLQPEASLSDAPAQAQP